MLVKQFMKRAQKNTQLWIRRHVIKGFTAIYCHRLVFSCNRVYLWPMTLWWFSTFSLIKYLFRPVLWGMFFHPSSAQMIMTDSVTAQTDWAQEFNSTVFPQLSLPAPTADTQNPPPLLPQNSLHPYAQWDSSGLLHGHFDHVQSERPVGRVKSNTSGWLSGFWASLNKDASYH